MAPKIAAICVLLFASGCTCSGGDDDVTTVLPAEVADRAALGKLADWSALPRMSSGSYRQQSSEDRGRRAGPHQPLWDRNNRDMNNFRCASADAVPAPAGTPFVVDRDRCEEPYVRGYVMARFEGSGRLARIWMTAASLRRGKPDREVLRIYVDDHTEPRVQAPLAAILDGSAGEIFGRPFGAGSGRYLAWYYPLVFSDKLVVAIDRLDPRDLYYHQTAVVLDEQPQPREPPPYRSTVRDRARELLRSVVPGRGEPKVEQRSLPPAETIELTSLAGPATIVATRLRLPEERLADLAMVRLSVHWDDAGEPDIDVSLADLFAAWHSVPGSSSLALGADVDAGQAELALRLPMPFRRQARWRLRNDGRWPLGLELVRELDPGPVPSDFGVLHVQANRTEGPTRRRAHRLAGVAGPGRLVGVCMMMHGGPAALRGMRGHPMNFLEGDEVGRIDGVRAIAGTGSEDYFNGAFYFEEGASATAFAQVWGIVRDEPHLPGTGRVTACRWHVLGDAVDFRRSLQLELEIGPGDPSVVRQYRSVAYLYRR